MVNFDADTIDFRAVAADVARALLGEPNKALSSPKELRWASTVSKRVCAAIIPTCVQWLRPDRFWRYCTAAGTSTIRMGPLDMSAHAWSECAGFFPQR